MKGTDERPGHAVRPRDLSQPPMNAALFAVVLVLVAFALVPGRLPRLFAVLGWCLLWWDGAVALTWHDLAGTAIVAAALAAAFR